MSKKWTTTADFILNGKFQSGAPAGLVLLTEGFNSVGDGAGGRWVSTGNTIAASRTPTNLGANKLSDARGNEFEFVDGQVQEYTGTKYYPGDFGGAGNGSYIVSAGSWSLVNSADAQALVQVNTFAELEALSPSEDGLTPKRYICVERDNAEYLLQPSGYVALAGDVTFANGRVAALQIDGKISIFKFGKPVGTDIADSFDLAASRTKNINIPAGKWTSSRGLLVRGSTADQFEKYSVTGDGVGVTEIRFTDNASTAFTIEKSALNDISDHWMIGNISDMTIKFIGATKANNATIFKFTSCLTPRFYNLRLEGATTFFKSFGNVQTQIHNVESTSVQRPALEGPAAVFMFDYGPNGYRTVGTYISDYEHVGAPISDTIFTLRAVDGLYVSNCHLDFAKIKVKIVMDNTGLRDVVKQVYFDNVYFDADTDLQGTALDETVSIEVNGAQNAVVDGLYFNNVLSRGGSSFFYVNAAQGLASLRDIVINGCHIRGKSSYAISLKLNDGQNRELNDVKNIIISNNIFEDFPLSPPSSPNLNAIVTAGVGVSVNGNIFNGRWEDGSNATILISAYSDRVVASGNIFNTLRSGTVGNKNIVVDGAATNVLNVNNVPV